MKVLKVNPLNPETPFLSQAASVIKKGGVVAFPTETFYGLGSSALNEEALKKVFEIKARKYSKPLLILLDSPRHLHQFVSEIPHFALKLIERFWPGGLTLIFPAAYHLSPLLTGNSKKIGIRVSSSPIVQKLVPFKAFADALGNLAGIGQGALHQKNQEFITAESAEVVLAPYDTAQELGGFLENGIPGQVAEGIIYRLKFVNIKQDDRERLVRHPGYFELLFQGAHDMAFVGNPC